MPVAGHRPAGIGPDRILPREAGVVIEGIASTQEQADALVAPARAKALHQGFAGRKATAGNLAFPFSPSDFQGGGFMNSRFTV